MGQYRIGAEDLLAIALQSAALSAKREGHRDVWFTEEPSKLHRTMKDIRDHYKGIIPELGELSFSSEGAFPYSPELRQIFGNLQLYGIIGRRNPSFDRFAPIVFDDTERTIGEELDAYLQGSDEKRQAFVDLVNELKEKLLVA